MQGFAGTGKSHMLDHARVLAEEHGQRVVALAPYAAHVRALRDLGVEAKTLASFLATREKLIDERTILVVDEAGTVPTRQMEQALKLAEQAGARVVLLGDTGQTKAIEAGRPFHQLQAAGMETAVMDQIQRQGDPALREAVALAARGESASSRARLADIREVRDDHERRGAMPSTTRGSRRRNERGLSDRRGLPPLPCAEPWRGRTTLRRTPADVSTTSRSPPCARAM